MKNDIIPVESGKKFLSEVLDFIPSNCLLDKGITGCGGTTLELTSPRHSIIAVPNISLVLNKRSDIVLGVYGKTSKAEILTYINNPLIKYKKIMVVYDSLPRIISEIGHSIFKDYFLLVDEYHILFNSYVFRNRAIAELLILYKKFDNFCFMTATPLNDDMILRELKSLPVISLSWADAIPVNITLIDTYYIVSKLLDSIKFCLKAEYNLHIFCNSMKSISKVIHSTGIKDYRVVCSEDSRLKYKTINCVDVNYPIQKINFYTATCFEGVDIYDELGRTIVVSDSNVACTMVDISTLFIQICGRLRDSKYKNEVEFIVNTKTHRYCKFKNFVDFMEYVDKNEEDGLCIEDDFNKGSDQFKRRQFRLEGYENMYVVKQDNKLLYDNNLKIVDVKQYEIVSKIYRSGLSVLNNLDSNNKISVTKSYTEKRYTSNDVIEEIKSAYDYTKWYKYSDIVDIFKEVCIAYGVEYKREMVPKILNIQEKRIRQEGKNVRLFQLIS